MVAYENEALVPGFDEEEGDRLSIILEGSGYDDRILILHLGGRIDTYNADYFERAIGKINATGYNRLLFMCGELNHVSASGVEAFSKIATRLKASGGAIAFAKLQSQVYDTFEILGLTGVYLVRDDPDKALTELASFEAAPVRLPKFSFACPGCARKLVSPKPGKFVCSSCRTRIILDAKGMARAC